MARVREPKNLSALSIIQIVQINGCKHLIEFCHLITSETTALRYARRGVSNYNLKYEYE